MHKLLDVRPRLSCERQFDEVRLDPLAPQPVCGCGCEGVVETCKSRITPTHTLSLSVSLSLSHSLENCALTRHEYAAVQDPQRRLLLNLEGLCCKCVSVERSMRESDTASS